MLCCLRDYGRKGVWLSTFSSTDELAWQESGGAGGSSWWKMRRKEIRPMAEAWDVRSEVLLRSEVKAACSHHRILLGRLVKLWKVPGRRVEVGLWWWLFPALLPHEMKPTYPTCAACWAWGHGWLWCLVWHVVAWKLLISWLGICGIKLVVWIRDELKECKRGKNKRVMKKRKSGFILSKLLVW